MNVQKRKKGVEIENEASLWSKAFSAGSNWDDKVSMGQNQISFKIHVCRRYLICTPIVQEFHVKVPFTCVFYLHFLGYSYDPYINRIYYISIK